MRADTELIELTLWREQVAIVLSPVPQMLDHQEIEQAARVDAEAAPCIALKQLSRQHYELTATHRRACSFSTSSQSVSAIGGLCSGSNINPSWLIRCDSS